MIVGMADEAGGAGLVLFEAEVIDAEVAVAGSAAARRFEATLTARRNGVRAILYHRFAALNRPFLRRHYPVEYNSGSSGGSSTARRCAGGQRAVETALWRGCSPD